MVALRLGSCGRFRLVDGKSCLDSGAPWARGTQDALAEMSGGGL